jgi:hypothetical protein
VWVKPVEDELAKSAAGWVAVYSGMRAVAAQYRRKPMKMVSTNGHQTKNVSSFDSFDNDDLEGGSFLVQNLATSLIGEVFQETSDQLYAILKKLTELRAFSLSSFETSNSGVMHTEEFDAERQRWLSALRHLDRELFNNITRLFLIRKQVLDAEHHVEMAELERSVEKGLVKSVKQQNRDRRKR